MANFKPFRALLPKDALASVSRPFDNYSREELNTVLETNPYSFLHVIVPAIPTDEEKPSYEERLKLGKAELELRIANGTFKKDSQSNFYLYRQTMGEEQYTGIIGAISIDDCINNVVKPHEQTIEHKEEKLKEYLKIIDIHAEPVVISYKADHDINALTDSITSHPAEIEFDFPNFGHHELWKIGSHEQVQFIQRHFGNIDELYICDGHHRTASSVLLGEEMRRLHPDHTGNEAYNYLMVVLFPHHQIRLREFNRLVKDLNGLSHHDFISKLEKDFSVIEKAAFPDITENMYSFAVYLDKKWYELIPREDVLERVPEQNLLPTQVLTDLVLSPILDIHDLRRDKRIAFKGGKTDADELMRLVDSNQYRAAFAVNKITIPVFKKFADNGWFMPPKSTWFEPKLLNGLVIYSLVGDIDQ